MLKISILASPKDTEEEKARAKDSQPTPQNPGEQNKTLIKEVLKTRRRLKLFWLLDYGYWRLETADGSKHKTDERGHPQDQPKFRPM